MPSASLATTPSIPPHISKLQERLDNNNTNDKNTMESNHDLPARTHREDESRHEQTQPARDDPATAGASEELKRTTISDKATNLPASSTEPLPSGANDHHNGEDKEMGENAKSSTPEPAEPTDAQDEEMRERLSSPKKKRGRDQDQADDDGEDQTSSADGSVDGNRTTRSEPEKKRRPRDTSEDFTKTAEKAEGAKVDSTHTAETSEDSQDKKSLPSPKITEAKPPQTSNSAFASSGFASLASSSTSGFGSLGASKPSVFGGGLSGTSGFGSLANSGSATSTTTAPAPSGFGSLAAKPSSGFGFGTGASSGFGGLASGSVFGSKLSNGFAGGLGPKLSSFAAPGKEAVSLGTKPAKAFGAPDSDEEDGSEDEGSDDEGAEDDEESGHVEPEDKKKTKLTKVVVNDGEAEEATLLQMRAKLFALESKEVGWKERGVGTLRVNVPKSCASYDDNGLPIPGSFDASGLEDEDADGPLVARLIMRQENTHRVILNTTIIPALKFEDKPSASTAQILFTAFEGEGKPKPVNMLLKMSETNARLFRSEVDSIQRELGS